MSLRVVIACDTFAPDRNGTATFSKNLAVQLHRRGYEVHVIAPATSRLYGTFRENHDGTPLIIHRLKCYRLPFQPTHRFANPIRLTNRITGLLKTINPSVVHVQSHINVGHHAAAAARNLGKRLIATSHVDVSNLVNNTIYAPAFIRRYLTKLLLTGASKTFREADAIAAPTKRAAQILEAAVAGLKVYPISGGVETEMYSELPKPIQSDKRLLYVGRLDREKHVYVLLEAFAKLSKDFQLHIVGGGSQSQELQSLSQELGVSSRVQFLGDISDEELVAELGKSSAFVMPSTQELQSMATLEAMAAGRPIIAANAQALPHLIHEGENGYLFKPDSPTQLAASIERLFNLPSAQFQKLANGSKILAQAHDLGDTVSVYERLYKGLEVTQTTLDNDPEYEAPISAGKRLTNMVRRGTSSLERGTSGVIERLDEVRGTVVESFGEVRFSIERRGRKARKRISSSFRKVIESIRRDD